MTSKMTIELHSTKLNEQMGIFITDLFNEFHEIWKPGNLGIEIVNFSNYENIVKEIQTQVFGRDINYTFEKQEYLTKASLNKIKEIVEWFNIEKNWVTTCDKHFDTKIKDELFKIIEALKTLIALYADTPYYVIISHSKNTDEVAMPF